MFYADTDIAYKADTTIFEQEQGELHLSADPAERFRLGCGIRLDFTFK